MGKDDVLDTKETPKVAAVKRPSKKKPKDKPKRPLSAYNFFFKDERDRILKLLSPEEGVKVENEPGTDDYITSEQLLKLKKEGGKVSFEYMGKLIGQRWKNIDPDRLTRYSELATEDTERYKKEMASYNSRQEQKMRSEALKPQPSFSSREKQSSAPPGYAENMAPYGSAMGGGYPYGMDYSGYGMPMGMYGSYGYPPSMSGPSGMSSGANPETMARLNSQMQEAAQQYGSGMYGMMGGGFMGYGGYDPSGHGGPGMDPSHMYPPQGGYGGGQNWGQQ